MAPIPSHVGKYRIERLLGGGGMGEVYLAHDDGIDRYVAIKLLKADNDDMRRRFRAEAQAVGKLKHPNIVTVYDYMDWEGSPCIVMEYVEGDTLSKLIRDDESLSVVRRLQLIEQVCRGLAYAHRAGIIHRDIKPSNLMIDQEGAIKIVDFGIARSAGRGMTRTGNLVGTLAYMSPEQIRGESVDQRCDIFAIGLVLFEFLTGNSAFTGDSDFTIINRIVTGEPEPFIHRDPKLSTLISNVLDKALAKERDKRYQDADQMAVELAQVRRQLSASERESTAILVPKLRTPAPETGRTVVTPLRGSFTPPPRPSVLDEAPEPAVAAKTPPPARAASAIPEFESPPPPSRRAWLYGGSGLAAAVVIAVVMYRPFAPVTVPSTSQKPADPVAAPAPAPTQPPASTSAASSSTTTAPISAPPSATPVRPAPPTVRPTTIATTSAPVAAPPVTPPPAPAPAPAPSAPAPKPDFKAELDAAAKLFDDGDYDGATRGYQAVLKLDPANAIARRQLQAVAAAQEAEKRALDRRSPPPAAAPAIDQRQVAARIAEGKQHHADGEYDAAIASYQAALKLDPKNTEATAGIAETQKAKAAEDAVLKKLKKPGGAGN